MWYTEGVARHVVVQAAVRVRAAGGRGVREESVMWRTLVAVGMLALAATARGEASFAEFDARATRGERLSVVYLGGSLTYSANASDPGVTGVRGLMSDYLRDRYPKSQFSFHDAAIGGTGSLLAMFRLERDVLSKKPDLVFLDFLCNDGADTDDLDATCAYEYILRTLVGRGIPVEQMFFTFKFWSDPGFDVEGKLPRRAVYRELGEAYGTPIGDVARDSLARDLASGKVGLDTVWPIDAAHPADLGYRYFFEAVRNGFERGVAEKAVCRVPPRPVRGTAENVRRTPFVDFVPLANGWRRDLTYRTSMWYDGLSSRWMGDVAAFSGTAVQPVAFAAACNFVAFFGEGDGEALSFDLNADGARLETFCARPGPGRLFVFRSALLREWLSGGSPHAFELVPKPDGKGELRIESLMTATLVPVDRELASRQQKVRDERLEALDHARGRK